MIRKMFNLRCKAGHYHYSPEPEKWVGRGCAKALDALPGKQGKKCDEPMAASQPPA